MDYKTLTKIRVVSDVHLEFKNRFPSVMFKLKESVDQILVLAGDIGYPTNPNYSQFISECSKLFKHVIVIAGNHEYYCNNLSMSEVVSLIEDAVSKYDNVHFLNRSSVVLDGIEFIGCTLWSDPTEIEGYSINDLYKIKEMSRYYYKHLHNVDKEWLTAKLNEKSDVKRVVITHHLPSFKLVHPDFVKYDDLNTFFYSNCDYLVELSDAWICGHTHRHTFYITDSGIPIVVNPIGYPGENSGFDDQTVVKV